MSRGERLNLEAAYALPQGAFGPAKIPRASFEGERFGRFVIPTVRRLSSDAFRHRSPRSNDGNMYRVTCCKACLQRACRSRTASNPPTRSRPRQAFQRTDLEMPETSVERAHIPLRKDRHKPRGPVEMQPHFRPLPHALGISELMNDFRFGRIETFASKPRSIRSACKTSRRRRTARPPPGLPHRGTASNAQALCWGTSGTPSEPALRWHSKAKPDVLGAGEFTQAIPSSDSAETAVLRTAERPSGKDAHRAIDPDCPDV